MQILIGPRHAKRARMTWHLTSSNLHLKSSAKNGGNNGFSFKERFLRIQLYFPDFYHFHHFVWRMKWTKKSKTKNGQNMSSGPFSHDAAHIYIYMYMYMYIIQLSHEGEVNSGGYIPRREASRYISTLFTDPDGDSCFSIYQIRWIKKCCFNFFFWIFRETTRHFSLRSQNSEYPRIFRVTGANITDRQTDRQPLF